MSIEQVQRKMVELLSELTEEAAKQKSSPLDFFDRIRGKRNGKNGP